MFTRLRGRHPAGLIVIGVVITLVLSGTAMAVTDTRFTYSTVQTGYFMLGAGDLVPDDTSSAQNYSQSAYFGVYGDDCFVAGVHLPQGASISSVRTSYQSGGESNIGFYLSRENPVTGSYTGLVDRYVSDDAGLRTYVNDVVPADRRVVNNALYSYTYTVCLGLYTTFYGAHHLPVHQRRRLITNLGKGCPGVRYRASPVAISASAWGPAPCAL